MKNIFRAFGPDFKKNHLAEGFDSVHIYPLMCKLLGVTPEPNNGSLAITQEMLLDFSDQPSGEILKWPLKINSKLVLHRARQDSKRGPEGRKKGSKETIEHNQQLRHPKQNDDNRSNQTAGNSSTCRGSFL